MKLFCRWLCRVGLVLAVLVAATGLSINVVSTSPPFRRFVERRVGALVHGRVALGPVWWLGDRVRLRSVEVSASPGGVIATTALVQDAEVRLDWSRLLRGDPAAWVYVRRAQLTLSSPAPLRATGPGSPVVAPKPAPASSSPDPGSPLRLLAPGGPGLTPLPPAAAHLRIPLSGLRVDEVTLSWCETGGSTERYSGVVVRGIQASQDAPLTGAFSLSGGFLRYAGGDPVVLGRVEGRFSPREVSVGPGTLAPQTGGRLAAQARLSLAPGGPFQAEADWTDLDAARFADFVWLRSAVTSGHLSVAGSWDDPLGSVLTARLGAANVWLNVAALLGPAVSYLGPYALEKYGIPRADLTLHAARREVWLDRVSLDGGALARAEGTGSVRGGELDLGLRVGLRPDLRGWFYGAVGEVFPEERAGFAWAEVPVTGPIAEPRADVGSRLADAIRGRTQAHFTSRSQGTFEALRRLLPAR